MIDFISLGNVGKLIALVVSVLSAYKMFTEVKSRRKDMLRADYEFAERFIAESKWEQLHDYLLERGYWGLSGTQLDASVIRYFLSLNDPLNQLTNYTKGQRFLCPLYNDGVLVAISYKGNLNKRRNLFFKKMLNNIGYFIFAFMSLAPMVFFAKFLTQNLSDIFAMIAWVFSFGFMAYVYLDQIWSLQSAERIVDGVENNRRLEDFRSPASALVDD
jgi:hypothetical protein